MAMAQVAPTITASSTSKLSFAVHSSLLASFLALVGFLAVACHHVH
jgi:hypothetical protein